MPQRKRPGAYHHGDLGRALTDAAIELLAEVGPSFTLRQAAKRVGVTHGAAYRHFEDRDALLAEVARRGYLALHAALERAVRQADTPRQQIEGILRAYVRFARRHPAQFDLMFGQRLNESGRFPALEAALEKVVMVLAGAVGAQLGTPDRTAIRDRSLAIWSLAHGYTTSVLHRRIKVKSTPAAERFLCELAAPFLEAGAAGR
ncbi:MAG: TetR/AcrR family transcriptional regulator [Myxococcales bacterium]|nr:TetR/AcrR family transcriptional regulator [Myxococcales bacterium]